MNQIEVAQKAIQQEIKSLIARQSHLQKVLDMLPGVEAVQVAVGVNAVVPAGKRRGRPRKARGGSGESLNRAIEIVKEAGASGVKAIRLARLLKDEKLPKVEKVQLLDAGITIRGNGGAATYYAQ